MYEIIDESLNFEILIKIEVLNFMILYSKFSAYLFSNMLFIFIFLNPAMIMYYTYVRKKDFFIHVFILFYL